jgi:hypothetical protein
MFHNFKRGVICICYFSNSHWRSHAITQAASRWLHTAVARVRARVWSCGICGGQSGARTGFFRVLRFPLPFVIPPVAPQSPSCIIWGWYNGPVVAAVPSGLSLTPRRIIIIKNRTEHRDWVVSTSALYSVELGSIFGPETGYLDYTFS